MRIPSEPPSPALGRLTPPLDWSRTAREGGGGAGPAGQALGWARRGVPAASGQGRGAPPRRLRALAGGGMESPLGRGESIQLRKRTAERAGGLGCRSRKSNNAGAAIGGRGGGARRLLCLSLPFPSLPLLGASEVRFLSAAPPRREPGEGLPARAGGARSEGRGREAGRLVGRGREVLLAGAGRRDLGSLSPAPPVLSEALRNFFLGARATFSLRPGQGGGGGERSPQTAPRRGFGCRPPPSPASI